MQKNWVQSLRLWLAFALAISTLFLTCWIFINAPTRGWLPLSVGAPEVSAWLLLASLIAIALAILNLRTRAIARVTVLCAAVAFGLAVTPLARFPATSRRFASAMHDALGVRTGSYIAAEFPTQLFSRTSPLIVHELFGGVRHDGSRVERGVPVGVVGGVPLTVDIYRPERPGIFPTVVQIYGGAWQRGSPGDNAAFAEWLAARGYVVFAIDYRHAPAARWPAQIDDVRTDLAWIRDHAMAYGADTARVAILGRSAGAQLAMMAAYTDGPLPIRAVLSYYGPVDLVDSYEHPPHPDPLQIRTVEEIFIGGTLSERRDLYTQASPITYATRQRPPTLLVYGDRDHIVEARYAVRLRDKLAATGTTVVLLDIPWADHAFDEVFNGPSSQLELYYTERFLAWALARGATH